ncbi:MAG: hypothetical protein JWM68_1622 [Verrucomicrobiales bacterium]|nr:hypothetical protein [Verrucomicrobiales bacterium]
MNWESYSPTMVTHSQFGVRVKRFRLLRLFATLFTLPLGAAELTIEDISPNLATNVPVIWKASTNQLPASFTIYKRLLPRTFSAAIISNALAVANWPTRIVPAPSTNRFILWDKTREGDDPWAGSFAVNPEYASIAFVARLRQNGSSNDLPTDDVVAKQAWDIASKLDLPKAELAATPLSTYICDYDEHGRSRNAPCGRNIWLSRRLNGISFGRDGDHAYGSDGLYLQLGSHGTVRSFNLVWHNLKAVTKEVTATSQQIIQCIRARHAPVLPNDGQDDQFFQRIELLSHAKSINITNITAYYGEGRFGEHVGDQETPLIMTPFAELAAVADLGTSKIAFRMAVAITAPDAMKLGVQTGRQSKPEP